MDLQAAVLARNRRHQGPHYEQQDRIHGEHSWRQPIGGRDVVRPRRVQVVPNRLELLRRRPGARDAPRQRSEVAHGAVVLRGSVAPAKGAVAVGEGCVAVGFFVV
ncbi:hypothetical protein M0R45_001087 [Rubus argutus]|uniref:Uncharacterized protein n=1 Tax=Rubus argutus TaxID=59490 RepID=A0AAW1VJQ5_RUBAR